MRPGYAFPMALLAVIVIAVVTTAAAEQVRSATSGVIRLADAAARDREAASLEQKVIYQLIVEPAHSNGLEIGGVPRQLQLSSLGLASGQAESPTGVVIRADGEPYRAPDAMNTDLLIRLLETSTFVNLATGEVADLERALDLLGVNDADHAKLAAALADYQDWDDFRRISGAEAPAYDEPDLPPNVPLREPLEVCRVAGWALSEVCSEPGRLLLLADIRTSSALNPRFASPMLLEAAFDEPEDAAQARRLIQSGAAVRFADVGRPELDGAADPFDIAGGVGPGFVLLIHPRDGSPVRRTSLRLTPQDLTSPYEVANRYTVGGAAIARSLEVPESVELFELPDAGQDAGARERP